MDWLSDGGGTISSAAKDLGLRLPHASATFKKLRTEGLITIDQSEYQKGSTQRLTQKGWEMLEHDELARVLDLNLNDIPSNAEGCLIAREGPMILLGYIKSNQKEGFILPNMPYTDLAFEEFDSTRSKGVEVEWSWAVSREMKMRWYAIPRLQPIEQVENNEEGGISNWSEREASIGLIRARLLEPENFSLPVGSWFPKIPPNASPKLPALLNEDYSWTLATFHDSKHKIKPQQPVVAEIDKRLGINLLLEAAARDGIIIGEAGLLSRKVNPLPISILRHWIKKIHPKLSEKVQKDRLSFLLEEIGIADKSRKKRRTSGEQSTWSKFKLDWPNCLWTKEENTNELFFDNSQLSKNALLSIIEWGVNDSKGVPLSIQWPRNINISTRDCEKILRYPALRIIILEKWKGERPNLFLKESQNSSLPIMDLQLERGLKLAISVEITPFELDDITPKESFNIPIELKNLLEKSNIKIEKNSEQSSRILNCCKQYPTGNEFEANKLEYKFPLESWIITPSNLRWLRWQRISNRIETHWVELLSPELIPEEYIGTIALNTSPEWKNKARKILNSKLQINPDKSLELRKIILKASEEEKAWWFSTIINSVAWLAPSIRINLIEMGLNPWIKYNKELNLGNFSTVINYLNWMQRIGEINDEWAIMLYDSKENELFSEIELWKSLIKKYKNNSNLTFEIISKIITKFDIEWWSPLAEQFLKKCIETTNGRSWLEKEDISWCAAILRKKGEIHQIPGFGEIPHPGCNNDLLENLDQLLGKLDQNKNHRGTMQLLDLKNSLRSIRENSPPKLGICHKHSGWLGQPLDYWPEINSLIDSNGDNFVSNRIQLRKSGYHKDLKNSPQSKLP